MGTKVLAFILISVASVLFYNSIVDNYPSKIRNEFKTDKTVMAESESKIEHGEKPQFVANTSPFPTYFFSHGGPTFMYRNLERPGGWDAVKKMGNHIKYELKPDYIIVVSAHWQSRGSNLIEIGVPPTGPSKSKLIDDTPSLENHLYYDFGGFPRYMYSEEFHTKNSPYLAGILKDKLSQGEKPFKTDVTEKAIDHGVWVPFKVAFSDYNKLTRPYPKEEEIGWDLPDTKLIQVSLTSKHDDFDAHFKLGQKLDFFRKNLIWDPVEKRYLKGLVVCSGMSVHNLYEDPMGAGYNTFTKAFGDLLTQTLETTESKNLLPAFKNFLSPKYIALTYKAHPTLEHFAPLVVAGGIASIGNDKSKEMYNEYTGLLAWASYEFK